MLYEMIEVDSQHTHDKGAAFQRWRHDHINRHVCLVYAEMARRLTVKQEDLKLSRVPHLTTVMSAMMPPSALAK
jgi:hypothetical protein